MPETSQRRFTRHDLSLPVQLYLRQGGQSLTTCNISRRGVFVRTRQPLPERQLIKLSFDLPASGPVEVMGMVVHVENEQGHPAGMGIRFFALSKEAQRSWDKLCLELDRNPTPPRGLHNQSTRVEDLPTITGVEITPMSWDDHHPGLDTRSPQAHVAMGQMLLEQMEDPAAAIVALLQALDIDPDYLPAHRHLRLAYALNGNLPKAYAHLRTLRRLENALALPG